MRELFIYFITGASHPESYFSRFDLPVIVDTVSPLTLPLSSSPVSSPGLNGDRYSQSPVFACAPSPLASSLPRSFKVFMILKIDRVYSNVILTLGDSIFLFIFSTNQLVTYTPPSLDPSTKPLVHLTVLNSHTRPPRFQV